MLNKFALLLSSEQDEGLHKIFKILKGTTTPDPRPLQFVLSETDPAASSSAAGASSEVWTSCDVSEGEAYLPVLFLTANKEDVKSSIPGNLAMAARPNRFLL
jgi:hypothetical protein